MGNTRGTIGRVCRWRDETNQMARWMGVSLLLAPERIQAGAQRAGPTQRRTRPL
ncbi:MAG: hypothetical protein WCP35_21310 [Verrucomicrobiota bacterium]